MNKLLILGTTNGCCDLVRTAKAMGIYTIVTDYLQPEYSVAKLIANEYWMIDLKDKDELVRRCKEEKISGILAGSSDFTVACALELTSRLNLPFYCTNEAWHYSIDKSDFKAVCRECGAPVAQDYFLSENPTDEELQSIKFPVVVKPVDGAANKGVSFCYNTKELKDAIQLVRNVSTNPKMVVERMIRGNEWYGSYAVKGGEIRFLQLDAMYHENGYPTNCYTITTTVTSYVEQYLKEINPYIEKVLQRIGVTDGFAWVQVMLDEDGHFYVIEMGYRLDGDMMFMTVPILQGYDVCKALVEQCITAKSSQILPSTQNVQPQACGCGHMLWTKKAGKISRIEGLEKVKLKYPETIVDVRQVVGNTFSQHYPLGTIVYVTSNCEELIEEIRFINDNVHIYDESGEDVIIKFTDFDMLRREYETNK